MRIFIYLLTCLFIVSCTKKDIPKDILRPEQMESVMYDLMRADEMVNVEAEYDTLFNRYKRSTELYQQVYRIHGTSLDVFRKSLHFYESRPDLFQPILDSLKVIAEKESVNPSITKPVQPEVKKNLDSIKTKARRMKLPV